MVAAAGEVPWAKWGGFAHEGAKPGRHGQNAVFLHTARPYSRSPCPYSHTRPRHRQPTVHQFTFFGRFSALSCTPRTPIYNFSPFSCTFVYAPFRPPRTLRGRCHFRGYTYRNPNCQSPDYQRITRNDRGRYPPYLDTYHSRLADGERGDEGSAKRGGAGTAREVTREVRSGAERGRRER